MKRFLWIGVGSALLAGVVAVTIAYAAVGAKLNSLEKEATALQKTNSQLSGNVVAASSLTDLEGEIEAMGLAKPEKVIYLTESIAWKND